MPISTILFQFFICKSESCPTNKIFSTLDSQLTTVPRYNYQKQCEDCLMRDCAIDLTKSLCFQDTESFLVLDPSISCTKEIYPFFMPGSLLILMTFTIGVPILYYRLVKIVMNFIQQIEVLESHYTNWESKTRASDNSCKQIYQSYHEKWKFFKIALIFYRLLVVSFFVFLGSTGNNIVAASMMLIVHVLTNKNKFGFSTVRKMKLECGDETDVTRSTNVVKRIRLASTNDVSGYKRFRVTSEEDKREAGESATPEQ